MKKRLWNKFQWYRKQFFLILFLIFIIFSLGLVYEYIPDDLSVERGKEITFGSFLPITKEIKGNHTTETFRNNEEPIKTSCQMECKLFGLVPLKEVQIHIVDPSEVLPGGTPIGIYVKTQGVLVVDIGEVETKEQGKISPAKHILKSGDYIEAVNGIEISSKEELIQAVNDSGNQDVLLRVRRNDEIIQCQITPVAYKDSGYRIGAWVRDDMAGIGTVTYIKEDGSFGALGHSISDHDTENLVEMENGFAYDVEILDIVKGEKGIPGELVGQIWYDQSHQMGTIQQNTLNGIFGYFDTVPECLKSVDSMPIGYKQDVKIGQASILAELNGTLQSYEAQVLDIDFNVSEPNKSMQIQITDKNLIDQTGGIIQGLSGSPIVQDGKLIGAVTHVFVNDPTKGYGIFIEDMLREE